MISSPQTAPSAAQWSLRRATPMVFLALLSTASAFSTSDAVNVVAYVAAPQRLALQDQSVCAIRASGMVCWGQDDDKLVGFDTTAHEGDTRTTRNSYIYNGIQYDSRSTLSNTFTCLREPSTEPDLVFPSAWGKPLSVSMAAQTSPRAACAAFGAGKLACWGQAHILLGLDSPNSDIPVANTQGDTANFVAVDLGTESALDVSVGQGHVCALVAADKQGIRCWGYNSNGQLGRGHTRDIGASTTDPVKSGPLVPLSLPGTPVQVTVGSIFTCALMDTGRATCWGFYGTTSGYLGADFGSSARSVGSLPGDIPSLGAIVFGSDDTLVVTISTYTTHSCAVSTRSELFCWGTSHRGALGLVGQTSARLPQKVDLGDTHLCVHAWTTETSTCALLDSGNVKCWGSGAQQFLRRSSGPEYGVDTPVSNAPSAPLPHIQVPRHPSFTVQFSDKTVACVMYDENTVQCWGENRACVFGVPHIDTDATINFRDGDTDLLHGPFALGFIPSPTSSPSATPSPSSTGTGTPSVTPSVSSTPTATSTPSASGTVSTTPTVSSTASASISPSPPSALRQGGGASATAGDDEGVGGATIAGIVLMLAVLGTLAAGAVFALRAVRGPRRVQARALPASG